MSTVAQDFLCEVSSGWSWMKNEMKVEKKLCLIDYLQNMSVCMGDYRKVIMFWRMLHGKTEDVLL